MKLSLLVLPLLCLGLAGLATADRNVICYFQSWSTYRINGGKFEVENIDASLCTHLIYAFAGVDPTKHTIKSLDPWNDLSDGGGHGAYKRFTGLKSSNPGLKTLLSVGGWNEGSEGFSNMVSSAENRKAFTDSVVTFLAQYGFDGLDLDWEYPSQRDGCRPDDKANFGLLMAELHEAFVAPGYLLSGAVPAGIANIQTSYDMASLSNLDLVNLMTFDYHGTWSGETGHTAPLYSSSKDGDKALNVDWTVTYYLDNGIDPAKMNMGVPFYGAGFVLQDPSDHGLYAPISGLMPACPYTMSNGTCGFVELCTFHFSKAGWTDVRDSEQQVIYSYSTDNFWVGYDDVTDMQTKGAYIRSKGLAGAVVWTIDLDDGANACSLGEKFPLLSEVNRQMKM